MKGQQIAVGAGAPSLLVDGSGGGSGSLYPMSAVVSSPTTNTQIVYLGGSGVDNTGYALEPGNSVSLDIINEKLYGISAAGSQTIHVLRRGE